MLLFIIAAVYPWRALIGPEGDANDKLGVVTLLQIHLQGTSMSVFNFMSVQ